MGFGHPHPFEQARSRPSATWPGGIMPKVTPIPVEPFTRAYRDSSVHGKRVSLDASLAGFARKARGEWSPDAAMTAHDWQQVDVLLDERNRLVSENGTL